MTGNTQDNPKQRRNINPGALARFLEVLSTDSEEASRRYIRLEEKLVSFFKMKGVRDAEGAAAETLDLGAIKISEGAVVPDAEKYCWGIAKNIAKVKLRRELRESSVFLLFIRNLADGCDEEIERIERVLKPCFEQLNDDDRELLLAYCQVLQGRARAEHRRHLAETMQITVLALRMRVTRLRDSLNGCVEKHSGGAAA